MTQSALINLHPNEYSQGLCYFSVAINFDRCVRSFNTLYDLSNRVCVPSKTQDLNLHIFNMITVIRESEKLTKHISCKCKCNFDGRKRDLNEKWNYNKCWCECKNPKEHKAFEKDSIWNPALCSCKKDKYAESIINDSVITCDEVIEETKTVQRINSFSKF